MAQNAPPLPIGAAQSAGGMTSAASDANGNGTMVNSWIRELMCCGYKSKCGQDLSGLKNKERYPFIRFLDQVPLLKRLSHEERILIADACDEQNFEPGTVVIKQGDAGNDFFVISSGEATVSKKNNDGVEETIVTLRKGDWFGENALLCDEPRVASVTAVTALHTLKLSRQQFKDLGLHQKLQFAKRRAVGGGDVLRQVITKPPHPKSQDDVTFIREAMKRNENLATVLNNLEEDKITAFINVAWLEEVGSGDTLIQAGDFNADYFYIVKEGSFEVTDRSEETEASSPSQKVGSLARNRSQSSTTSNTSLQAPGHSAEEALETRGIQVGGCFGELALLYLTQRTATVRALENSVVWVIDRPNFKKMLMAKSEERINEYTKLLEGVAVLNCLAVEEKKELANALVEMQFTEGEVIVQQGEKGKTFYILYDGEVTISQNGQKIRDLHTRGQYFGEKALLADDIRTATVTASSSSVRVLALDHESFGMLLGPLADLMDPEKAAIAKTMRGAGKSMAMARSSTLMQPRKFTKQINFEDLQLKGLLGNGGFGRVELYVNRNTNETYALKSMSKGHIVKVGMQNAVVNEKKVLMTASSVFIVKLHATYNWEKTVCFLLELLLGGELYATYTRENLWGSEVHAKYYGAMVILAFAHLHEHRILYRDLKPENVVLNDAGVPKLVDMGLAKCVVGKTYTTCGTPDYFAPEVITGSGHNHAVDWWTLGIMVFEMLAGSPPFTASAPMQIFKNVLGGIKRVAMPKKCQGAAGTLIKALLKKDPSERLPMRSGGVGNIQKSEFYTKFDWNQFQNLEMKPPYKPAVKNPTDMSNFNARAEDSPKQVSFHDDGSGWDLEFDMNMPMP